MVLRGSLHARRAVATSSAHQGQLGAWGRGLCPRWLAAGPTTSRKSMLVKSRSVYSPRRTQKAKVLKPARAGQLAVRRVAGGYRSASRAASCESHPSPPNPAPIPRTLTLFLEGSLTQNSSFHLELARPVQPIPPNPAPIPRCFMAKALRIIEISAFSR